MPRRRFSPSKHPRNALGRFRPTYVPGSATVRVGRGGAYRGIKAGAEFRVGNRQVLVKAIVGVRAA